MNCEDCTDKISFIVYGEEFAEEIEVLEHIGDCDSCRDEFIQLLEVKEKLDGTIGLGTCPMTLGEERTKQINGTAVKIDEEKSVTSS